MMNQYSLLAWYESDSERVRADCRRILGVLGDKIPKTRNEISRISGIPEKTLTWRVKELLEMGVIRPAGEGRTQSGRRAEKLGLT